MFYKKNIYLFEIIIFTECKYNFLMLFFKTNIVLIKKTEKRLHNKLKFVIICVHGTIF